MKAELLKYVWATLAYIIYRHIFTNKKIASPTVKTKPTLWSVLWNNLEKSTFYKDELKSTQSSHLRAREALALERP